MGDRFYPSPAGFAWVHRYRWRYRRWLKGHLTVDPGLSEATTGELARGVSERDLPNVRRFPRGVPTHLGILQEAGQEAPWIIARDCPPTAAAGRDAGARWAIEPRFSAFKRRGFHREDTPRRAPERLDCLRLIMTLAMEWGVRIGRHDALYNPTPVDNQPRPRPLLIRGA